MLDLLGGIVRRRPLTGEEAMAQLIRLEEDARRGNPRRTDRIRPPPSRRRARQPQEPPCASLLRKAAARKLPEALHLLGVVMLRGQGLDADPPKARSSLRKPPIWAAQARPPTSPDSAAWGSDAPHPTGTHSTGTESRAPRDTPPPSARRASCSGTDAAPAPTTTRPPDGSGPPPRGATLRPSTNSPAFTSAEAGLAPIPEEAARWLTEAALSGVVEAQYRLGVHYWAGRGGRVDLREAVRWTCRAAENGSTQALTTLADFFLTGSALDMNRFNAYTLLKCAARLHDAGAATTLTALERMLTRSEKARATRLVMISENP